MPDVELDRLVRIDRVQMQMMESRNVWHVVTS